MRVRGPALVAAVALLGIGATAHTRSNPVQRENAEPGTTAWRVHRVPQHALEGYASEVSVLPGQALHLHVSSSARVRYVVRVYRIGWYGGTGGRLMPCAPCRTRRAAAQPLPAPDPSSGLLALRWPVTDVVPVGQDWVSGYYLADLVVASGPRAGRGSWVPFVVREPATRHSAILVQASANTWQAYNNWGGRSLYWNHSGVGDNHVSFDRPYSMAGAPADGGREANLPTAWELPLVRFLERYGYDASYTTDVDVDAQPAELLRHRIDVVSGHDEYWTNTMRDAYEAARDAGVSLAFVGANIGYWRIRYEDGRRTIVEYRSADEDPNPDPAQKTITFREAGRPECRLLGVQWGEIGNGGYSPVGAFTSPPDTWFDGTGFYRHDELGGLVGYEYDGVFDNCTPPGGPVTILFQRNVPNHLNADAVRYTAPSGAKVFSAGSIRFATGLDPLRHPDPRLQRFMRNALGDMLRR